MRYRFVRSYNPAYDYFILNSFKRAGIDIDEGLTLAKAERIMNRWANKFEDLPANLQPVRWLNPQFRELLTPEKRMFWDYVVRWRREPDCRPSYLYFVEQVVGKKIQDVSQFEQLQSRLPPGHGKLLFGKEDVATATVNFYKRYINDPLRRAVDEHKPHAQLTNYFTYEEIKRLPDSRVKSQQEIDVAAGVIANEVLAWASSATQEKVALDIGSVLEEHGTDTGHMRSSIDPNRKMTVQRCNHKSRFMELDCWFYPDVQNMFLKPNRGFLVWLRNNWETRYADVIFPEFYVKKAE